MSRSPLDFVRQRGFTESEPIARQDLYAALMFQPRVIGVVVLAGILLSLTAAQRQTEQSGLASAGRRPI